MKMIYGGTPVKSLNIHHFEMDTNDASLQPSDMQAGVTAYARGQKLVGTGKAFNFAMYGDCESNIVLPIPTSEINTVVISASDYMIRMTQTALYFKEADFSTAKEIALVAIDGANYPISMQVSDNMLIISCDKTITLQVMFGKDDYT